MAESVEYTKRTSEQIRAALLNLFPDLADKPQVLEELVDLEVRHEDFITLEANCVREWEKELDL